MDELEKKLSSKARTSAVNDEIQHAICRVEEMESRFEKLAQGVVYLLNHFFHILEGFDINKYLLIMNIGNGYNDAAYHQNIAIILALVYLVAGTVLAMMITKKRDVR